MKSILKIISKRKLLIAFIGLVFVALVSLLFEINENGGLSFLNKFFVYSITLIFALILFIYFILSPSFYLEFDTKKESNCFINKMLHFCTPVLRFFHPIVLSRFMLKDPKTISILSLFAFLLSIPIVITSALSLVFADFSSTNLHMDESESKTMKTVCNIDNENSNNKPQEKPGLFWSVFYHFMDPGNQQMAKLGKERNVAILLSTAGLFIFSGLIISLFTNMFDKRRELYNKGLKRYKCALGEFIVIIGGNKMVVGILKQIFSDSNRDKWPDFVIIQTTRDIEQFRAELYSAFREEIEERIVLYYGNRGDSEDLSTMQLEKASELYLLGEDGGEEYHDSQNMQCLHHIAEILGNRNKTGKLDCRVLFEYQTTFSVFQFSDIDKQIKEHINFLPFNYYEIWAQKVLVTNRTIYNNRRIEYTPLDNKGIAADSDKFVHFIIIGMSKMGIAMAIEAAHIAHYPNFENKGVRSRITFIDKNAKEEMNFFMGRYKTLFQLARWRYVETKDFEKGEYFVTSDKNEHIYSSEKGWRNPLTDAESDSPYKHIGKNLLDIDWEFINGSIESPVTQQYLRDAANEENANLTVCIALPRSHEALAAGLYLPTEIYDKVLQVLIFQPNTPDTVNTISCENSTDENKACNDENNSGKLRDIYEKALKDILETKTEVKQDEIIAQALSVIMPQEESVQNNGNNDNLRYYKVRPFGMLSECYNKEEIISPPLVNYVYRNKKDKTLSEINEKINEEPKYLKYWDECSVADKWSSIYNTNTIYTKLRSIGCYKEKENTPTDDIIQLMYKTEHNRWNTEKLLMGFRPLYKNELQIFEHIKERELTDEDTIGIAKILEDIDIANDEKKIDEYKKKYTESIDSLKDRIENSFKDGGYKTNPDICSNIEQIFKNIAERKLTNEDTIGIAKILEDIDIAKDKEKIKEYKKKYTESIDSLKDRIEKSFKDGGYKTNPDICSNIEQIFKDIEKRELTDEDTIGIAKILEGIDIANDEKKIKEYKKIYTESIEPLKKRLKDSLKKGRSKAHLDICPYDELETVDKGTNTYDKVLTEAIPYIIAKSGEIKNE